MSIYLTSRNNPEDDRIPFNRGRSLRSRIKQLFLWHLRKTDYLSTLTLVRWRDRKLQKAAVSFVMSVSLSAWNDLAPTGWILMKFNISASFRKPVDSNQVPLKSEKNNSHFTRKRFHIYNISLNTS